MINGFQMVPVSIDDAGELIVHEHADTVYPFGGDQVVTRTYTLPGGEKYEVTVTNKQV
jgi:hypothetical protein